MGWFRRGKKTTTPPVGPQLLQTGLYRSPGFAMVCRELELSPPEAILDLGPPSTENVAFLSSFTRNVTIQDFFRGCTTEVVEPALSRRARSSGTELCRVVGGGVEMLPDQSSRFDLVLMWDLLHYLDPEETPSFVSRLAAVTSSGALLHLFGSATAPIPRTPIGFKIERADRLFYTVSGEARAAAPGWLTRDVERVMQGFRPKRLYQLRNGLQEFVLERE